MVDRPDQELQRDKAEVDPFLLRYFCASTLGVSSGYVIYIVVAVAANYYFTTISIVVMATFVIPNISFSLISQKSFLKIIINCHVISFGRGSEFLRGS